MSDITTIDLNGTTYEVGSNKGLTDGIKNALIILGQSVSYKDATGKNAYANLVSELTADELSYTSLCENYSPNLASFSFPTVYVDFDAGDYIEAVIDRSAYTQRGGNLLSIGTAIDTWGGWCYHIPAYPSDEPVPYPGGQQTLSLNVFAGSTSARSVVYLDNEEDYLVFQIKNTGLYVNGVKIFADDDANELAWLSHYTPSTGITIGSTQGNVRSDALYKYVRIYRGA